MGLFANSAAFKGYTASTVFMRRIFIWAIVATVLFAPLSVFAADPITTLGGSGTGLVPQCEGAFCRACDLLSLANNVIQFGVAFSIIIAALMFAYAGILYVTAAGAGTEQIKKAHTVFANVFIGFVIVLTAWLLVNIFFSVLSGKELSVWTKISCVSNPTTGAFQAAPALSTGVQPSPSVPGSLATSPQCAPLTSGPCSPSNLIGYFGPDATTMSSICHLESGGNPAAKSGTDRLWYDQHHRTFSVGLFQVNLTQHNITCGGRVYNCPAAFRRPANPNETRQEPWGTARAGAGFGYTIINEPLYNLCVTQASNPTCNLQNAQSIYQRQGMSAWATSANRCGLN